MKPREIFTILTFIGVAVGVYGNVFSLNSSLFIALLFMSTIWGIKARSLFIGASLSVLMIPILTLIQPLDAPTSPVLEAIQWAFYFGLIGASRVFIIGALNESKTQEQTGPNRFAAPLSPINAEQPEPSTLFVPQTPPPVTPAHTPPPSPQPSGIWGRSYPSSH